MKEFVISNWLLILILFAIIGVLIFLALRGKKEIIAKILYTLVTEAEKCFGGGTGSLKFAYVVEKIYSYLPSFVKMFITYKRLKTMIENALCKAKKKWLEESGISNYLKPTEYFGGELISVGTDKTTPDNNEK